MELRHLRYFLAVANHLHFRIAAEELLVSQPTLSEQIKDLEKELGTDLFERTGRRVRLTQAGEFFQTYARRALSVIEEGLSVLHEFDELLRGRLRVGVVQTVGTYMIPQVIAKFSSSFPLVSVRVENLSADEIENGLMDGSIDLGITFTPDHSSLFNVEPIGEEQFVLVVSKSHRFASRKRIRVLDLSDEPLCLMTTSFCTRRLINAAFAEAGANLAVAVEMTSIESCRNVTLAGGPPTIIPQLAVMSAKIPCIRIEQPMVKRTLCLLSSKTQTKLRCRDEFAKIVREMKLGD
jgi:LysR family cyn operon transcriptional activator